MQDGSSASMTGVQADLSTASGAAPPAIRPRSVDPGIRVIRPAAFSFGTVVLGLRTLLHYSDLLYTLSVFRLNVRYKQSALGWAWAALQPLALMGIYTFIFAHVTTVKTGGIPYPIFVFSALLPWIFFASAITNSVQGLIAYPNLLTKMYFPREIIPFSYLAAGIVDFLIASVILAFLMVHYLISLTWNVLYSIPIFIILVAFAAAMALLFSAVHVRFRDVGLAMPFVLQVWMFATPVVYSIEAVPPRFRLFFLLDPAAGAIDNFRRTVVYGKPPNLLEMAWAAGIAAITLAAAYAYFKSSEAMMADII